jgi:hypothetical protein
VAVPNAFVAISQPVAAYTGNTCLYSLAAVADFTQVPGLVQCGHSARFFGTLEKRSVPGSWATWGSPPDTETATPNILYTQGASSLTIKIKRASNIVGFEVEPNQFQVETITATFYNKAGGVLGTITRSPNGSAGALLYAAKSSAKIARVVVTNTVVDDFSIANLRVKT